MTGDRECGAERALRALAAAVLWCVCSLPAAAQQPGLLTQVYAPNQIQLDPSHQGGRGLMLRMSVFDNYDQNNYQGFYRPATAPTPSTVTQPFYVSSGNRIAARGEVSYRYDRSGPRGSFATDLQAFASAYSGSKQAIYRGQGTIAGSTTLGRRNGVGGHYSATYAPYYGFGLFPGVNGGVTGALADPDLTYAVTPARTLRHSAGVNFNRGLSRYLTFGMDYSVQYRDLPQNSLVQHQGGAHLRYQVSRDLGVRFGYIYRRGTYSQSVPVREFHDLDLGIDYQKAVTFAAQRLTFSGTTGSSFNARQRNISSTNTNSRFDIRIIGQANLDYSISRYWSARLAYQRGWQFVDAFDVPTFQDTVTAAVGGPLGSRLTSGMSLSYLHGTVGYTAASSRHEAYAGRANLNMRLVGALSAFANYTRYRENLPTGTVLPAGFPAALERTGISAGVSYAMTLFGGGTGRGRP